MRSLRLHLTALVRLWEDVQVELHGRYSLARLYDVIDHAKRFSKLRNATTVLLTPGPCLAFTILMDTLPIRSPALGFAQQTPWVVVRFLIAWSTAFMIATQIHQSSPTLPFPTARRLLIPTVEFAITTVLFIVLSWTVAFPAPFPFQPSLPTPKPATNDRYLPVFAVQMTILVAYPVFNVALHVGQQASPAICLLGTTSDEAAIQNLMSKGVFHMEDLAPSTIVFNIDVFHAVYVSSTMQQAQTSGATIVIMIIDIVQSIIAYYEIHQVQQHVIRLARECDTLDRESATTTQAALQRGLLPYALHIVETCQLKASLLLGADYTFRFAWLHMRVS